ncbi:MAG: Hsp20/alpha crystallin family protein [Thermodesulfovibrionales bacterium]|nr:Hsp20/alpha crystallin family protein [Thermodesulfovibrionales bacterium]
MSIRNLITKPFSREAVPVRKEDDNPFLMLQREMNAVFENFFRDFESFPFYQSSGGFSPKVDVLETEKEIKINAELPGMDEKDIDVSIHKDAVTIKGEKKLEKEDKGKDYYRMERSYGSFSRTIPIHVEVNTEKAEAKFSKGLLTITIPKTEKAIKEVKKIAIKTE